jgi:hypothetical protein
VNLLLCQHNTNSWGTMLISYFRTQTKKPIAWETLARVIFLHTLVIFKSLISFCGTIYGLMVFILIRTYVYKGYRNRT